MDSNQIPIIDCSKIIGAFGSLNEEELIKIAQEFGNALSGIGFAYLINHGVDMEKLKRIYKISKDFFDLPTDVKRKYHKSNPAKNFHGYSGPGDQIHDQGVNSVELRELWDIWGPSAFNEKDFPIESPEMKEAFDDLRLECNNLTKKLLRCIGIFLKLDDKDFFVKNHRGIENPEIKTQTQFRTMYYYSLENSEDILENAIRIGEHSDWGTITLLFQDMTGGLEVKRTNGDWVKATPIQDSVIINTGQLLELWTAGRLPATPHRVRIPNDEKSLKSSRQSCIYFVTPDGNTEVNAILPILLKKPEFANRPTLNAYKYYEDMIKLTSTFIKLSYMDFSLKLILIKSLTN